MVKRNSYKKAQAAVEFVILFSVVMFSFVGGIYYAGKEMVSLENQRVEEKADELNNLIQSEIELASKAEGDYSRAFELPSLVKRDSYSIQIYDGYEMVLDYNDKQFIYPLKNRVQEYFELNPGKNTIAKVDDEIVLGNSIRIKPYYTAKIVSEVTPVQTRIIAEVNSTSKISSVKLLLVESSILSNYDNVEWKMEKGEDKNYTVTVDLPDFGLYEFKILVEGEFDHETKISEPVRISLEPSPPRFESISLQGKELNNDIENIFYVNPEETLTLQVQGFSPTGSSLVVTLQPKDLFDFSLLNLNSLNQFTNKTNLTEYQIQNDLFFTLYDKDMEFDETEGSYDSKSYRLETRIPGLMYLNLETKEGWERISPNSHINVFKTKLNYPGKNNISIVQPSSSKFTHAEFKRITPQRYLKFEPSIKSELSSFGKINLKEDTNINLPYNYSFKILFYDQDNNQYLSYPYTVRVVEEPILNVKIDDIILDKDETTIIETSSIEDTYQVSLVILNSKGVDYTELSIFPSQNLIYDGYPNPINIIETNPPFGGIYKGYNEHQIDFNTVYNLSFSLDDEAGTLYEETYNFKFVMPTTTPRDVSQT